MFEYKSKIGQTHDIIQKIDEQLNDYLAQKGLLSSSQSEKFLTIDQQVNSLENANHQLRLQNSQIQSQNAQIQNQVIHLKEEFQERMYAKLLEQQENLQQQFEQNVSKFGEKARLRLMSTLQYEDQYQQQVIQIEEEKAQLQSQIDAIKQQTNQLFKEKNELEGSYSSLMQMHNQLIQIDMTSNEGKNGMLVVLNNYKFELEQLKQQNENLQQQMNSELDQLKDELQRQKAENQSLVIKAQQAESINEQQLYEKVFAIKQEKKKKKPNISKQKLEHFEKELKRLQDIVSVKILQKKQKQ